MNQILDDASGSTESEPKYIIFRTTWMSRWLMLLVTVLDYLEVPAKYTSQIYAVGHQWNYPEGRPFTVPWMSFTWHALVNLFDLLVWDVFGIPGDDSYQDAYAARLRSPKHS